jgi:hypothetical protein
MIILGLIFIMVSMCMLVGSFITSLITPKSTMEILNSLEIWRPF